MVYGKQDGALRLESCGFSGGRFVATAVGIEPHYFITDHLGGVRAVVNSSGEVLERNDYYPFGKRWDDGLLSDNRYRYNGKEAQSFLNNPYTDYGARQYDPDAGIWHGMDKLLEKYYPISPYAFCANNPIRYVDPDGKDLKEGIKKISRSIRGEITIGAQFGAKYKVLGRSVEINLNLQSKKIGGLEDGKFYSASNETYTQGFGVGVGLLGFSKEQSVEQTSENTATVVTKGNLNVGVAAIETTEEESAKKIGQDKWVIDDSQTMETSTDVTIGGSAAAIVGVSVEVDLPKLWEGVKELFK